MSSTALPDGILLNIYFHIHDYNALSQFPLLSKRMYYLICRYKNTTQMHRIDTLKRNLFELLDTLVCEDEVFHNTYPHCDLIRMYRLYKKSLTKILMSLLPLRYVLLASDDIANMMLVSGEENVGKLLWLSVYVPSNHNDNIRVCTIPCVYSANDDTKDCIFDILRNSKYKFNEINFKYITRVFDSVFRFN